MNVGETEEEKRNSMNNSKKSRLPVSSEEQLHANAKPGIAKLRNWPVLRAVSFLTNYYKKSGWAPTLSQCLLCCSWVEHAY